MHRPEVWHTESAYSCVLRCRIDTAVHSSSKERTQQENEVNMGIYRHESQGPTVNVHACMYCGAGGHATHDTRKFVTSVLHERRVRVTLAEVWGLHDGMHNIVDRTADVPRDSIRT